MTTLLCCGVRTHAACSREFDVGVSAGTSQVGLVSEAASIVACLSGSFGSGGFTMRLRP